MRKSDKVDFPKPFIRSKAMLTNHLYHNLHRRIRQLRPQERITRIRNLAWLMSGIFLSRSVHLSRIASKIPGTAVLNSIIQRVQRFLNNPAVRVRDWYEPVAQELLRSQAKSSGAIRLIVDGSKIGFGHQLLMVGIAYRRRALPLAWTWVRCKRGHSAAGKQLALLNYVHALIPPGCPVSLCGDSEFGASQVLQMLEAWRWDYVLRQKGSHLVQLDGQAWQRFGDLIEKAGQSLWLGSALLTQKHAYRVNLLAHWKRGEKEPWLLATNLPSLKAALSLYRRRMWIEEMFGDFKKHGFDLESTHLRHFLRLSRLTLAVSLLYVWLVSIGSQTIKNGKRYLVDRRERRDLSIFRIGFNIINRYLTNGLTFSIPLVPYF
jgi:hypothetical protein